MEILDGRSSLRLKKQIALARMLQESTGHHQDWVVLESYLQKQVRKAKRDNLNQLAIQMTNLLSRIPLKKSEIRGAVLPVLQNLQASLQEIEAKKEKARRRKP
jgi:hypothetical protein